MPKPTPEAAQRHQELNAAAMLVGEGGVVYCSACMGNGVEKKIFGWKRCVQCEGRGFELLGPETERYMKERFGV